MRGSSFDRDEARKAWRQVARMRGLPARERGAPRLSAGRIGVGILVAVFVVLGLAELASDDDEPTTPPVAEAKTPGFTTPRAPAGGANAADGSPTRATSSTALSFESPSPAGAVESRSASAAADTIARPSLAGVVLRRRPGPRVIPPGTARLTAKAYAKVPLGRDDLAPIGDIAPSGMHIDRIALGNNYADNRCAGPSSGFTIARDATVNVCIRAVHLRESERVVVRWEKDGRLVKVTRLHIPPKHAYRTRAGLRVRRGYQGNWQVRILTQTGEEELARANFTIDA